MQAFTIVFLAIILFFTGLLSPAKAQQLSTTDLFQKTDVALSMLTGNVYQVTFRFKSAPKTDTSTRSATVMLFAEGLVPNDSLKSYVVLYPDSSRTEAFDGRYFYEVNHKLKTIRTKDAAQSGYRKAVSSWAADFAYQPLLRKTGRHFLPHIYKKIQLLEAPQHGRPLYKLEYVDSTLNDHKMAAFDPDYVVSKTIFDINASTFHIQKIVRWVTFMATPQCDETIFSDFLPLPDSVSFATVFDPNRYWNTGYVDYETYKAGATAKAPASVELKTGDTFPTFRLSDTDSKMVYSDSLKTGLLLVDFWYQSCYPCLKAMPGLENLHQKYGAKGLQVLGINARDDSPVEVKEFMLSRQVHYPSLIDKDGTFAKAIGIKGYPTVFLIEAVSKKILFQQIGYSDNTDATLEELVSEALSNEASFEVWEVENMAVVVEDDDPFKAKSQLVNAALNRQMQGCRYFISKDSMIIKDADQKVMSKARILEKSPEYYTIQDEKGDTAQLKYSLNTDRNQCTFTYPNGSTLIIRKKK